MRGGQCGKRTSTLTAIHYCTVDRQLMIVLMCTSHRSDSSHVLSSIAFLLSDAMHKRYHDTISTAEDTSSLSGFLQIYRRSKKLIIFIN